jgi:hypothetical protein
MTADRDQGQIDGSHYRELPTWPREIARNCRPPNPRRELLDLAPRYEIRAGHLDRWCASAAWVQ